MRAQALQLTSPELHWVVAMWFDVIGDASRDDLPSAMLQLQARSAMQLGHSPPHRHISNP
jgi:hypothetical protein